MRRFKWIEWNLQKIDAHGLSSEEVEAAFDRVFPLEERKDDSSIRAAAVHAHVPCITTLAGIQAIVSALTSLHRSPLVVRSLQSYHERVRAETRRTAGVKVRG